MLWLKAFHIVFVVTWFAGLFYLPRLFVYHARRRTRLSIERFKVMERRLFAMMTIGAALAVAVRHGDADARAGLSRHAAGCTRSSRWWPRCSAITSGAID